MAMWLAQLFSDLRLSARALARRPGYALSAVTTLAIGLGASVAIFSVMDAVLLRPLPYAEPERLVRILMDRPEIDVVGAGAALGDFQDYRRQARTLAALAAYTTQEVDLTGLESPEVVRAARVSPDLFRILGVEAAAGRTFLREEEVSPHDRLVVLSHGFWRSRFGGRPALGARLELDGQQHEVIGVMPADFRFPQPETQLWLPLTLPATGADRMSHYLGTVGRLAPDATLQQANTELEQLSQRLARRFPASNEGWRARGVQLSRAVSQQVRPAVLVLFVAVGLLLLISCFNVANLLLVRGGSRKREAAIRAALGAPPLRMASSLLVESLTLAVAGGALGVVLAYLGVQAVVASQVQGLPQYREIAVTGRALGIGLVLVVGTGLVTGLSPALVLSRPDVGKLIQQSHGTGGREDARLRTLLVIVEVALVFVLLIGATLMLQSFREIGRIHPGFDSRRVLVQRISLSPQRYSTVPRQVRLFENLLDQIRASPQTVAAAAVSAVPLHPAGQNLLPFQVGEAATADRDVTSFAVFSSVTPEAFQTLGIPLREGRDFTRQDDVAAPPVLIVDEGLASRFWPGGTAIGKHLTATIQGDRPLTYEIVGVVGAVRSRTLTQEPELAIYAPYRQVPPRAMTVVVRSRSDPLAMAGDTERHLHQLDPDQPIQQTTTLDAVVDQAAQQVSFYTLLLGLFALTGLVLAAVGIYGVIAYSFAQRQQEMAIRVALGARSASVVRLVVGAALRLTCWGSLIGFLVALAGTRWLSSVLYQVEVRDPLAFALVGLLLGLVGTLASVAPARQAVTIDPSRALR